MVTGVEFGDDPWRYDANRPSYGDEVPRLVARYALLGTPSDRPVRLLEPAAGTGIATAAVLGATQELLGYLGRDPGDFSITLIDPSEPMLEVASEKLADYGDKVKFVPREFKLADDSELSDQPFDLAFAATVGTALRWLAYDWDVRGVQEKFHGLLRPAGHLAIMHNMQAVTNGDREAGRFYDETRRVWHEHLGEPFPAKPLPTVGDLRPEVLEKDLFKFICAMQVARVDRFTTESYLERVRTLGPVLEMEPDKREAFLGDLGQLIRSRFGGRVRTEYATTLTIARRV